MPRKDSPRTEPQSRRDRYDEADPEQPAKPPVGQRRGDDEVDTDGQSGYAAGDGRLVGSGAWSGRANPQNASPGSGPIPNEGTLREDAPRSDETPPRAREKSPSSTAKRSRRR